jgi:carbon-monoxide dehydrogenase large subunit
MKESGWYSFPSNDSARISIDPAGNVTVFVGTPSVGQGVETTMAQVAADTLGVPLERVRVVFSDTSAAPLSMGGTRASRAAVVSGGAVGLAAEDLRARLLKVAGALTETPPDVLEIADGEVRSRVTGASVMDVTEVVRNAFQNMAVRHVEPEPNLTSTRFYDPKPSYSNACIGAVVEVDVRTGHVRVLRLAGVEDCGVMINPAIVEGQFFGGVTQGLGGALLERSRYDDAGQPQASTFMDYRLPSSTEVPMIEVRHRESPSLFTWGGFKGVGESGTIGAPAAIATAVADALSEFEARIGELPLSPEDVVELARWPE